MNLAKNDVRNINGWFIVSKSVSQHEVHHSCLAMGRGVQSIQRRSSQNLSHQVVFPCYFMMAKVFNRIVKRVCHKFNNERLTSERCGRQKAPRSAAENTRNQNRDIKRDLWTWLTIKHTLLLVLSELTVLWERRRQLIQNLQLLARLAGVETTGRSSSLATSSPRQYSVDRFFSLLIRATALAMI